MIEQETTVMPKTGAETVSNWQSRGRPAGVRDDDPHFVFGRYRPGPSGSGVSNSASGVAGPSSLLRRPPLPPVQHESRGSYREEEIYESADPDRGEIEEAHDSGSDEFNQAQHLVRSASEEALPVTVKRHHHTGGSSSLHHGDYKHDKSQCETCSELYPSPPSDEDESYTGSLDALGRRRSTSGHHSVSGGIPGSPSSTAAVAHPVPTSGSYSRLSASDESRESSRDAVSSTGTEETALINPTRYPEYKH